MPDLTLKTLLPRPWAVVVRVIIIVSALGLSTIAWQMLSPKPQFVKFSQVFELNFEGLSAQQFPDGTPFLLSDVVSRSVLAQAHQSLGLEERHQLSLDELQVAVQVAPYSADYQILIRNARQSAADEQSASEIARIRQQLLSDLNSAQSGAIQLSLVLPEAKAIPPAVAFEVLDTVAQTWATRAVIERGVLGLEIPIYTSQMFQADRFERLDYLVAIELLLENINLIRNNINLLREVPNAFAIRDSITGFSLEDTAKALDDIAQIDLRLLVDPIRQLGLTRNPESMQLLYKRRLSELRLERDHLLRSAQVTQDIMNIRLASEDGVAQSLSQLGDAFIDRLIDLAAQSEDEASRQVLAQQVLQFQQQVVELSQEEAELMDILARINGVYSSNESLNTPDYLMQFEQTVEEEFPRILAILAEYTDIVERIHTQLGNQAIGGVDQLLRSFASTQTVARNDRWQRHQWVGLLAFMTFIGIISLFIIVTYDAWRYRLARRKTL